VDIFWSIFFSLCCLDNDKPFCPFHICDFMVYYYTMMIQINHDDDDDDDEYEQTGECSVHKIRKAD